MEWLTHAELNSLTSLDLTNVLLTDFGVKVLCESGILKRLKSLNLSWNDFSKASANRLAKCADASNLRTLEVTGTRDCPLLV